MLGFGRSTFSHLSVAGLCFWGVAFLGGCAGSSDAPPRFSLSGQVTFDGKPVPAGTILFSPDSSQGNQGPGTSTTIEQGAYRTRPQKGVIGGPMLVEITGYDGIPIEVDGEKMENGKMLFKPYRTEIDLPHESFQHDFDIPKSAQ